MPSSGNADEQVSLPLRCEGAHIALICYGIDDYAHHAAYGVTEPTSTDETKSSPQSKRWMEGAGTEY